MPTQHVMSHADWIDAGGWAPAINVDPVDVVIACVDDDTGEVIWASWDAPDVDPATRINPDLPAVDHR